jgi:hypothetical protein
VLMCTAVSWLQHCLLSMQTLSPFSVGGISDGSCQLGCRLCFTQDMFVCNVLVHALPPFPLEEGP